MPGQDIYMYIFLKKSNVTRQKQESEVRRSQPARQILIVIEPRRVADSITVEIFFSMPWPWTSKINEKCWYAGFNKVC